MSEHNTILLAIAFAVMAIAGEADDYIRQAVEMHPGVTLGSLIATVCVIGFFVCVGKVIWR